MQCGFIYVDISLSFLNTSNIIEIYTPFTKSCDFTTIIQINHDLKKAWIGANRGRSASKPSNLGSRGFHYDVTTMPLRKTRCWQASTTMLRRPMPTRDRVYCVYATLPATTFKILLRHYADLDDCTTISLRWSRSYYDCITLLVRFWRWCIYVLGLNISKLQTWIINKNKYELIHYQHFHVQWILTQKTTCSIVQFGFF